MLQRDYKRRSSMGRRGARFERLEDRRLLASDWQNAFDPLDVDGSEIVSPIDALLVINELDERGSRSLPGLARAISQPPYWDTSGDGWISPLDVLLVVNGLNEPRPALAVTAHLAPEADLNGNGVVLNSEVIVMGQTLAKARVTLTVATEDAAGVSSQVIADANGRYSMPVELQPGKNIIKVLARGRFGDMAVTQQTVRLGDVILDWNASLLNVIRDWTTTSNDPYLNRIVTERPPVAARNLAMVHVAMYDAVNGILATHQPYHVQTPGPQNASPVAAAAAAAERVAAQLYKDADDRAVFSASLAEALATVPDGLAKTQGIAYGQLVGDAILALRSNDGAPAVVPYTPGTEPGQWQRTFPDYLPPLLPQWPHVRPFAIPNAVDFRPAPPPALDSAEYAAQVDEVMRIGALHSTTRTAEQTEIALFWADGGGTFTPPGHWNQIAGDVALAQGKSLADNARIMALLNMGLADAGIASWDAKYHYDFWRPVDAIRFADADGNPATTPDPTWMPLVKTPPFPTYTSGHSTFSGAAAAILSHLLGADVTFSSQADGHLGFTQRPLAEQQVTTRTFSSFAHAAEEASKSRLYGGIHFSFDNTVGLSVGQAVGEFIVAHWLTAVPN